MATALFPTLIFFPLMISCKRLKPGFFSYAVGTNLFRLESTNPKKNSQFLDASDYYDYEEVGINNLAELRYAKV